MVKHILITGASGLIGTRLTEMLLAKGYSVAHLGRSKKEDGVKSFVWNVDKQIIQPGALKGITAVIHLAGAGVADKRWTEERKQEILESRTKSTALLLDELKKGQGKTSRVALEFMRSLYTLRSIFCSRGFSFLADVKQGEFPFGAVVLLTPSLEMTCFGIRLFV